MQVDDPPYLSVGTAVSAKYKGAFCEAKVSKVVRVVKCKVTYKMGLGTATVSDEQIKGLLRVGQLVQAKHSDKKEYVDATITKIQDCSQYTVVFDDGDITTLRRTALCLKSGRHFNESETLDQLPLTHPEHFGNPVVGGRRGRRSRQAKEDSSEGEGEEENEPDLEVYTMEVGRVVCVEASDKKRSKDNWFPGLVVMPSAQLTVRINVKDEFLVRSFKDGRYYTVPQKEVTEFSRDMVSKIESTFLSEAVEKALKYLDSDELPLHWERDLLFCNSIQVATSDSDDRNTDSSDDETPEEKDHFVAQLYKFMDDSNTPLNKSPVIGNKDVDLHRLFRVVRKLGGYNRVTNKNKWRSVALRLKLTNNPNNYNQVKLVYKKFLLSFEAFHRTLGVTMLSHPRNAKKSRGRNLIRDKDRSTPVNSPRPDKEEEPVFLEKKEEEKVEEKHPVPKPVKKSEIKPKEEEKKVKEVTEVSDTNSSDTMDLTEIASISTAKLKRSESVKPNKERKVKPPAGEKVKAMVEKLEEQIKIEDIKEEEKVQQTRSKNQIVKAKEKEPVPEKRLRDTKTPLPEIAPSNKTPVKVVKKPEDDKKRGRKRFNADDKEKTPSDSGTDSAATPPAVNVGDKLKVYYGPTHESKVTYEAKVVEIESSDPINPMYMVHYTGWNTRYDEWIKPIRIAENLSATTKAKKLRQNSSSKNSATKSSPNKRGRRMSITGRSTVIEPPRSTTPSSVTSTSSRTKSPGTPVTRASRTTRQGGMNRRARRTSVQTDASDHNQSESDSEGTESDSETIKTRSGSKLEDSDEQVTKKKLKPTLREKRIREDEETEKEEEAGPSVEIKPKRTRKLKKILTSKVSSVESDDDSGSPPKGRDFDLIQIRSELKGFVKAAAIANAAELVDKEVLSSDESNTLSDTKVISDTTDTEPEKLKTGLPKSSSSDDIYEFKEPEPFEFETRSKLVDEKVKKRLMPRMFEEVEKPKKKKIVTKAEVKEEPEVEKKRPKQSTSKKSDINSEEDETSNDSISSRLHVEDPFDKLVESPSFHSGREKPSNNGDKPKFVKSLNLDEPLNLFHNLTENAEDDSGDHLDISDSEEPQNEPLFTHKEQLFSDSTFGKASPEQPGPDPSFRGFVPKSIDRDHKDSDDDDTITESIQNVINQVSSSTDDDNDDILITNPAFSDISESKVEVKPNTPTVTLKEIGTEDDLKCVDMEIENMDEKIQPIPNQDLKVFPVKEIISPALQETNTSLLELISKPPEILTKLEDTKDIAVKTGTKIADTLLQKFSMVKSPENKSMDEEESSGSDEDNLPIITMKIEAKQECSVQKEDNIVKAEVAKSTEIKLEPKIKPTKSAEKPKPQEVKLKAVDIKPKVVDTKPKPKVEPVLESKKRSRKIVSREFIEDTDSDSDSTDSGERLVIARSDEESQTNSSFDVKVDAKDNSDDVVSNTAENSQTSCDSNFKFSDIKESDELPTVKPEVESVKEEEPDSHLHSLLLCEETIPGSPAPQPEAPSMSESRSKTISVLEMPFASAPGTSNNSNKSELAKESSKGTIKERNRPPPLGLSSENREKDNQKASAVLDNTPPLTPESTISNLSPRGDIGGLSPNTADDSCKSGEGEPDYNIQRRSSANKISYSEDGSLDAILNADSSTSNKKHKDAASACRKRRRSCKATDEVPVKRGRKPLNRSRHTSDSDDTTFDVPEQSLMSNASLSGSSAIENQMARSPKSKYNFLVDLDSIIDSNERIAMLQQKMQEVRTTYAMVKTRLAAIERRRKKLRRREREAKMAKQESQNT